ncbi:hypothetical protein Nepgr_009601 [Nepenthes gracilis]|uniref:Uncharacterized protein n=1 Tax=Nepenthes gracilis TaxID=150966 RepID=A0AAD3SBJ7_NEPGR|nr:hypothetical protein Nepgr_009601 [Nepenthes gracilis]
MRAGTSTTENIPRFCQVSPVECSGGECRQCFVVIAYFTTFSDNCCCFSFNKIMALQKLQDATVVFKFRQAFKFRKLRYIRF